MPVKWLGLLILLSALGASAAAEENIPPDIHARFIAGLPVPGSPLEALSRSPAWMKHAATFNSAWAALEKRQLTPIRGWMNEQLVSSVHSPDPVLYMFSGPDILYAHTFFPDAAIYVLCGIEPIGPLPDVTRIPNPMLGSALFGLQRSLDSVLSFSFFITEQMKHQFKNTQLTGTLPVLYTFLARSGCSINDVSFVNIDREGALSEGDGKVPGVKITFTRPGHASQTVYYFSTDLTNHAVSKNGFLKWVGSLGKGRSFLKAASYLMHGNNFTEVRARLLEQSTVIIQDDSGVPIRFFDPTEWRVAGYGNYVGPITRFQKHRQPQLSALYERGSRNPLPFSFGYRWRPAESTLIVATRTSHAPDGDATANGSP